MSTVEIISILAIVVGPVFGALIAIHLQDRQQRKNRREEIFKTLMRTRRNTIWPEHVGALNLVEIEFDKDALVIRRWKELIQHLGQPNPRHSNEELAADLSANEVTERNRRYAERIANERQALLSKLLHEIGRSLGYKIEQLEIFEGGYTPQGWNDDEVEQRLLRRQLIELLRGRISLRIIDATNFVVPNEENVTNEKIEEE